MSALRTYHQFLGNGIDAVLLGPGGAMSPEAAQGLDRCYWYKSDLYYADQRRFAPGDDPWAFLAAPPGGTSHQLAPLGRAWFDPLDGQGRPSRLIASRQEFWPELGLLLTQAEYAGCALEVRTTLAAGHPALFFDLRSATPLSVLARAAPGLWPEDTEWVEPAGERVALRGDQPGYGYRVGGHECTLRLVPVEGLLETGVDEGSAWLRLEGRRVRWWVTLVSSRYPQEAPLPPAPPDFPTPPAPTRPAVELPDADYQRLHAFSMYMFPAMQHRYSGGLPVNNLRRTFNSHVFWDGAFVQRSLLEAGQVQPAREAWRFLARTREAAAANALQTFGAPGLHWDWETTHSGERAYLPWLQQRFQVHNTPLLAHMVLADYRATRDLGVLAEGLELLAGAAAFVLAAVLVDDGPHLATRPLVGSHEAETPVVNDGATVAAAYRLLRDTALAERLLGRDTQFGRRCAAAAHRLRPTVLGLFNGRYCQASADEDRLNTSSLAPIYPTEVIAATDRRALATAAAYRARYAGRMAGHGNNEQGFPWSAGVLARILAYQGQADAAWEQLDLARVALCAQGGCAEYVDEQGRWNLQYFSTAQAALCSALHALLLQAHGAELRLFPALPTGWERASFRGFLAAGLRLDATYERGVVAAHVANELDRPRPVTMRLGAMVRRVQLPARGEADLILEGYPHG